MADLRERLLEAIKEHSGMEDPEILDAGRHGADAGWPGFSYYKDTAKFYEDNEEDIWELIAEEADSMGEEHPLALIAKFGGAKNVTRDHEFQNLLAWFVLEDIGHWLEEQGVEAE